MRKIAVFAAALMVACMSFAGLDMYTGKTKTTLLNPSVLNDGVAVTNSTVTGVDVVGLPGNGVLVVSYKANNQADAVVTFAVTTCATTNGTYAAATVTGLIPLTNGVGTAIYPYKPVNNSRYVRVTATPSATVTNGIAAVTLLTE
jgi:hypothetical protein